MIVSPVASCQRTSPSVTTNFMNAPSATAHSTAVPSTPPTNVAVARSPPPTPVAASSRPGPSTAKKLSFGFVDMLFLASDGRNGSTPAAATSGLPRPDCHQRARFGRKSIASAAS
jgi:hypothetical protein